VRTGATLKSAAACAGVGERTLHRWKAAGEQEDAPAHFRAFSEEIARARAQGRVALVTSIRRAAEDGDWRASAWILERAEPEEWSLRHRLEHSGANGGPIKAAPVSDDDRPSLRDMSTDDLEALREILRRTRVAEEGRLAAEEGRLAE